LSPSQIIEFIEQAHVRVYEALGPSLFRMFQTYLNGYEYCLRSKRRELHEDKSRHFRHRLEAAHPIFRVCERFAPNLHVSTMASNADRRLSELIGSPLEEIRTTADNLLSLVEAFAAEHARQGEPPPPRTFPCKRYIYDGRGDERGRPFRVECDTSSQKADAGDMHALQTERLRLLR
jgi:hypothetical protein